jgi:hypothetical protein
MEFYEQKTTTFQNQNGRVRSAFKVVNAKDGMMKSMEGVSNKNNNTLYHILQTIRKNNMEMRSRYSIHIDDLKRLLMEGDRIGDYRKMENTPVVRRKGAVLTKSPSLSPSPLPKKKSQPSKKAVPGKGKKAAVSGKEKGEKGDKGKKRKVATKK